MNARARFLQYGQMMGNLSGATSGQNRYDSPRRVKPLLLTERLAIFSGSYFADQGMADELGLHPALRKNFSSNGNMHKAFAKRRRIRLTRQGRHAQNWGQM